MVTSKAFLRCLILVILSASWLLVSHGAVVQARDSDIVTTLCDSGSTPTVTVSQPVSDSVVTTSQVGLTGNSEFTTQIDVFVNNTYSHSIPVEPDGAFTSTVGLQQGTNSIRLESYFSCNQNTSTNTVVVTYQPAATPSDGGNVDTGVGSIPPVGEPTPSPAVFTPPATEDTSETDAIPQNPLERITKKLQVPPANDASSPLERLHQLIKPLVYWAGVGAFTLALGGSVFTGTALAVLKISSDSLLWGFAARSVVRVISIAAATILLVLLLW